MRLMPHHQDMGGFFATLLKKVAPLPGPEPRSNGVKKAMAAAAAAAAAEKRGGGSGGSGEGGTGAGPSWGGLVGGIPRAPQAGTSTRCVSRHETRCTPSPRLSSDLASCEMVSIVMDMASMLR